MKAMILITLIVIMSGIISCCSTLFSDEKLTLQRVDYNGNELKINGYYYNQEKTEKYEHTSVMYLYRNGIILTGLTYSTLDLCEVEEKMMRWYDEIRNDKPGWGVFLITNNQIVIEQWNAPTGYSLPTMKHTGYIENDTTIHIIESYFSDIKKTYHVDEVWHFKQFENKPDSTNVYIK